MTISGGIVNLHDRDTEPAQNTINVQTSTITTEAWLTELNDADGTIMMEGTSITGINITVVDPDAVAGGNIRLVASKLLTSGPMPS